MANSRAKSAGWSTNERLTSAQATAMDVGQANALCRSGTTALTAGAVIQGGGYGLVLDFTDDAASYCTVQLDTLDFTFSCAGAGNVVMPAGDLQLTGSGWPILGSRNVTDQAVRYAPVADATAWDSNSLGYGIMTASVATATSCSLLLGSLIPGLTITGFKVDVRGATSGSLPGTMPVVSLFRFAAGAYGTPSETVGSATDASPDDATYVADHQITKTGLSHAVSSSSQYILNVSNGYGGGAATGFRVYRCYISGTLATLRTALAHGHHQDQRQPERRARGPEGPARAGGGLLLGAGVALVPVQRASRRRQDDHAVQLRRARQEARGREAYAERGRRDVHAHVERQVRSARLSHDPVPLSAWVRWRCAGGGAERGTRQ
jgi:hypothetical protein